MAIESPARRGAAAESSTAAAHQPTSTTSTTFSASTKSLKRTRADDSEEDELADSYESESSLSSLSEAKDDYVPSRAASYEGDDDKEGLVSSKDSSPRDEEDDSLFSGQESSASSTADATPAQSTRPAATSSMEFPFAPKTRGSWSKEEDKLLLRCVRLYRRDWKKIAAAFSKECTTSSRTAGACSNRYKLLLDDMNAQQGALETAPVRGPLSQASSSAATAGPAAAPRAPRSSDARPHQDRLPSASLSPAKRARIHSNVPSPTPPACEAGPPKRSTVSPVMDDNIVDFDTGYEDAASAFMPVAAHEADDLDQDAPFFPRTPHHLTWAEEEDDCLYRCVRKEGQDWARVTLAYAKEASDLPPRSAQALEARHGQLLEEHRRRMVALQAQDSATHQDEGSQPDQPTPSPQCLLAPPSAISSGVLLFGDSAWSQVEEACLLSSAIRHQATKNVAVQVRAVVDDYNAAFPTSNRTIDSIHIKFRQLLQDHLEEQREVEAQAGSEARAGGKSGDEQGAGGVDLREKEESQQDEPPRTVEHAAAEHQQADAEQEADQSLAPSRPDSQREPRRVRFADVEPCSPPVSRTPADSPRATLPACAVHVSFNDAHIYGNGTGFRFERMPRGSRIAILSPTYAKVYRREDEERYQEEEEAAAFIFTLLRDGLIEATRCPPHTTSYCVRILEERDDVVEMEDVAEEREREESEEEEGSGGGGDVRSRVLGIETRYCGVDGFAIVFFAPV